MGKYTMQNESKQSWDIYVNIGRQSGSITRDKIGICFIIIKCSINRKLNKAKYMQLIKYPQNIYRKS